MNSTSLKILCLGAFLAPSFGVAFCSPPAAGGGLCPQGQELCGDWWCLNPDRKLCTGNTTASYWYEVPCCFHCFDPTTHECRRTTRYTQICSKNLKSCKGVCYNPTADACFPPKGQNGTQVRACANGQKRCGSGCYDPETEGCHKSSHKGYSRPCPKGQHLCEHTCYSADRMKCFHDDQKTGRHQRHLCFLGEQPCGSSCFNATIQHCVSHNGVTGPCYLNELRCGRHCFSPAYEECIRHTPEGDETYKDYFSCRKGERVCGFSCYNPKTKVCLLEDGRKGSPAILCAVGQERCGNECYEPTRSSCVIDEDAKLSVVKILDSNRIK